MVSTNNKGELVYIYFDGTVDRKKTIELSSDHYFDYKDIDGDHKKDKIFISKLLTSMEKFMNKSEGLKRKNNLMT